MKPRARALLVVTFALFVGCDPGITIRQINSTGDSKRTAVIVTPDITIEVKTTHPINRGTLVQSEVNVMKSSDSPITITSVELVAQGVTYENKPRAKKSYPLTLLVLSTASLDIAFDFSEGVCWILKEPAELRIHYLTPGPRALQLPRMDSAGANSYFSAERNYRASRFHV
jgi:hypothetical protein